MTKEEGLPEIPGGFDWVQHAVFVFAQPFTLPAHLPEQPGAETKSVGFKGAEVMIPGNRSSRWRQIGSAFALGVVAAVGQGRGRDKGLQRKLLEIPCHRQLQRDNAGQRQVKVGEFERLNSEEKQQESVRSMCFLVGLPSK